MGRKKKNEIKLIIIKCYTDVELFILNVKADLLGG